MARILCFLFVFFLTGCQKNLSTNIDYSKPHHSSKYKNNHPAKEIKDGAPKGPVPTFFKRVVPTKEPLSRYGNPETYEVSGRTYSVMSSANGYHKRGVASWYGTKFHSKRTSSGEPYDMYALTAAHKTLPLPTYVRVKNLNNGRVAIVKVNDRGPFHSDRILDLSYGAAVKLGLFPKGTADVDVVALTTPNTRGTVAQYYVQVGAFSSRALANSLQQKLKILTKSPIFIENYNSRYIVKVGPFGSKNATQQLKNTLAKHQIKGAFSMLN